MRRLMNYLRGMAVVRLTGLFPERLINLCAQEGIEFWAMEWLDEHTVRFTTRRYTLGRLAELAERAGCEVKRESSRGLPDFLSRFRTRYAFLAGLAFALCAVSVLSRFVLTVEVTGNERVPTAVILSQLRQLGVRPGVYGPSLNRKQLAQDALLGLEDLSWMAINLHGTRVEVVVREAVKRPERLDESGFFHIVAQADGVVVHMEGAGGANGGRAHLRYRVHGAAPVYRYAHCGVSDPRPGTGMGPVLADPHRCHPGPGRGEGVYRGGKKRLVGKFFWTSGENFWKH